MQKIFILFLLVINLYSTEYQLLEKDLCITDYWDDNRKCIIKLYVDGSERKLSKRCNRYTFVDDNCTDSSRLALEKSQYEFLMGLTANLLGFMLIFLVGFLFVLQGRR